MTCRMRRDVEIGNVIMLMFLPDTL